ncbi:MAG: TonB C-terminal domain-containing protein [Nitrospinales bacterium]
MRKSPVSIDFNRMLVLSVSSHLFFMTVWIFFPEWQPPPKKVIKPAFMVELIDLPSSQAIRPEPEKTLPRKKEAPKPVAKKPETPKPAMQEPKREQAPVKQVVEKPDVSSVLLRELELLNGKKSASQKAVAAPILKGLDQLAMLRVAEPKKRVPKKRADLERAIKKLRAVKRKRALSEKRAPKKAMIEDDVLDKPKPVKAPAPPPAQPVPIKPAERGQEPPQTEEMKFVELSKRADELDREELDQTLAELLEALEQTDAPDTSGKSNPKVKPSASSPGETLSETEERSFKSVFQKLSSLDKPDKSVDIEIAVGIPRAEEFRSQIGSENNRVQKELTASLDRASPFDTFRSQIKPSRLPSPAPFRETPLEQTTPSSGEKIAGVSAPDRGRVSADLLSLYIGKIRQKIDDNWKIPLGTEYQKEIVMTFLLFSQGNIDKPAVKESSGEEKLDALAKRAIYDSVPFPKFPEGLKESNLTITIRFKYTHAKN